MSGASTKVIYDNLLGRQGSLIPEVILRQLLQSPRGLQSQTEVSFAERRHHHHIGSVVCWNEAGLTVEGDGIPTKLSLQER